MSPPQTLICLYLDLRLSAPTAVRDHVLVLKQPGRAKTGSLPVCKAQVHDRGSANQMHPPDFELGASDTEAWTPRSFLVRTGMSRQFSVQGCPWLDAAELGDGYCKL